MSSSWRVALSSAVIFALAGASGAAAALVHADPAPPPPMPPIPPGYPVPGLLVPGKSLQPFGPNDGFLYFSPLTQTNAAIDARGVGVATNADPDQAGVGLPGSRLGSSPVRIGHFGPTPGVRVNNNAGGVQIGSNGSQLESPDGSAPPHPPTGNESIKTGPSNDPPPPAPTETLSLMP